MDIHQLRQSIVRVGARLKAIEIESWGSSAKEDRLKPEILTLAKELTGFLAQLMKLQTGTPSHDELCALAVIASNNFFVTQNLDPSARSALAAITPHGIDALANAVSWVPNELKGLHPPHSTRASRATN